MSVEAGKTVSHSPFNADEWRSKVKQYLIHHLIQMSGEVSKTVSHSPYLIQMSEEASKTVSHSPFNSDEWRSK